MKTRFAFMVCGASLALVLSCNSDSPPVATSTSPTAPTATPTPGFPQRIKRVYPWLTFAKPVGLEQAPTPDSRLFVVELNGVIKVVDPSVSKTPANVFLDIRDRVTAGGEMGLLGLAFHPKFVTNHYFYLNYTTTHDKPNTPAVEGRRTVISRFTVSDDGNRADPKSERILLEFDQPYANHNGGALVFGPDGFLYIGVGDGGSGGDPKGHGQDVTTLLGSVLRIDVDKSDDNRAYGIPADNPFANGGGAPEIFAWGMRNPWRMSWDFRTQKLWAGDVGQLIREEVDIIERAKNYGWNQLEGTLCYSPKTNCDRKGMTPPVWEYDHNNQPASITGGYVYYGKKFPRLVGHYVYADYILGKIWALKLNADGTADNRLLVDTETLLSSFGQLHDGEILIVDLRGGLHEFN